MSDAPAAAPRKLAHLALTAIARSWHPGVPLSLGDRVLPVEVAKLLWAELKARAVKAGEPISCAAMYPFVRHVWRVSVLDLSDSGNWLVNTSLQALPYLSTTRSVRLTACRFIDDAGLDGFVAQMPLTALDVSWTNCTDASLQSAIGRCTTLTSLNLTGLSGVTDRGISSLLGLRALERLSLCCTSIGDPALDYLTYYTRFPEAGAQRTDLGVHGLRWLELSNTRLTDTGVGKLVAIIEDGVPYGKVFKRLEYLALSMTQGVGPPAVRQVLIKYGLDQPLPNAQRTLAKSNAVALEARDWVIRFMPTKERQIPAPKRSWEEARALNYIAQYTKEMAAAEASLAQSAGGPPPAPPAGPDAKRQRV